MLIPSYAQSLATSGTACLGVGFIDFVPQVEAYVKTSSPLIKFRHCGMDWIVWNRMIVSIARD